jgi:transposase-like protein/IS1 family transposase
MNCPECNSDKTKKNGKDRKGNQRFICLACEKTFDTKDRIEGKNLAIDKALLVVNLLVEGNSVRSTERITGVHRDTILRLMVDVAEKCEKLMIDRIKDIPCKLVQADEIWSFVEMKEKTKHRLAYDDNSEIGDAYTFVAMEQNTKLVLAFHLGRRTVADTIAFTEKLDYATRGHFQVSTDGFAPYRDAFGVIIGHRTDFAQIVKVFGTQTGDEHRYSFPEVIGMEKTLVHGRPDMDKATTSHVERQNLTMRMSMRRFTRLTNGFSKKWLNLYAMLCLHYAYYNFCRVHSSIRVTPAMEAKITDHVWTLKELLLA